jgi:anthranilate/para-aminobenzoate synthase component II
MHGKISEIKLEEDLLFSELPKRIKVTRYHSLILENITPSLEVVAETSQGEIMAIRHKELPLRGIQFHPEAILTENGKEILLNWLTYYNLIK